MITKTRDRAFPDGSRADTRRGFFSHFPALPGVLVILGPMIIGMVIIVDAVTYWSSNSQTGWVGILVAVFIGAVLTDLYFRLRPRPSLPL